MKIKIISSKEEIETIKPGERIIHLAFRPSNKDIMTLYTLCPSVQAFHIPSSYMSTLSESIRMFLSMNKIALLEGDVWGHRKDLNEYFEVPKEILDKINELKNSGVSTEEIISITAGETKLGADLVRFVLNS